MLITVVILLKEYWVVKWEGCEVVLNLLLFGVEFPQVTALSGAFAAFVAAYPPLDA